MVVLVLALLGVVAPLTGQATYTVQPGDTLWALAGENLYDNLAWRDILRANDFLNEPGRVFVRDGRTIAIIRPGEQLTGLNKLGIVSTPVEPQPAAPLTFEVEERGTLTWLWWLLGLVILAGLVALVWLYTRPTNWRPMVPGGARNDEDASQLLAQQASRKYASVIPGSQQRVRLYGVWAVRHQSVPIPIPHSYNGERAWRARFRMPNGTEQTGYMLQSCGNDVSLGGAWYVPLRGARVEDGWEEEVWTPTLETRTPAHTEETARVAETTRVTETIPAPTPITSPTTEPVAEDDVVKIEIRPANDGQPEMIRLEGVDERRPITYERHHGSVTLRFIPRQQ